MKRLLYLTIVFMLIFSSPIVAATSSNNQSLQDDISKALDLTIDLKDFIGIHKESLEEALTLSNVEYIQNDTVLAVAISENTLFSIMCDGTENTCSGFTIFLMGVNKESLESCLKNLDCSVISDEVWLYKDVLFSIGEIDTGEIIVVTEDSYDSEYAKGAANQDITEVSEKLSEELLVETENSEESKNSKEIVLESIEKGFNGFSWGMDKSDVLKELLKRSGRVSNEEDFLCYFNTDWKKRENRVEERIFGIKVFTTRYCFDENDKLYLGMYSLDMQEDDFSAFYTI